MHGILLINLGSPDDTKLSSIKSYLKEFLMDEYVIDIPKIIRNLLVNWIIVPFRSRGTQKAYSSIWTDEGSPLILNTIKTAKKLEERLGTPVECAMRYKNPSIESALKSLSKKGCTTLKVIPLYPHYAMATSLTTELEVKKVVKELGLELELNFVSSFYNEKGYIDSLSSKIDEHLTPNIDYLLFSYHGVPERHITKTDPTKTHCLKKENCCEIDSAATPYCYKAQVLETSRLCASKLNLESQRWGVAFQSRIGPGWLQPFSDIELKELPKRGKKNIAVVCPAFIADNLETLEEMDIRGRETFLEAGGESFTFIPCLNSDDSFIDFLSSI
jgi:ferrochelatase